MLTPGDIRNRSFEKVRNGYQAEEVQPFLNEIASSMEALLNERADLYKKLEILADKIEKYKEDEDYVRAALINAEKMKESVVRDSKRKAEAIIAQATRKSEEIIIDAQASINREAIALNKIQKEAAKFKSELLNRYKKHIEIIQELPFDEANIPNLESSDIQFVANIGEKVEISSQGGEDAIDNKIEFKFDSEISEQDGMLNFSDEELDEESDSDVIEAEDSRKNNSKFGELLFGDKYKVTRKE